MNFVLADVDTLRKEYPDPTDPQVVARLLTVEEYHTLARRIIGLWAPPNSKAAMLGSDDAISFVAHHIMMGDWGYEPQKSEIQTYREYCGKGAIKEYLRKLAKQKVVRVKQKDGTIEEIVVASNYLGKKVRNDSDNAATVADTLADPEVTCPMRAALEGDERQERYRKLFNAMKTLSDTQRACIIMHYIDGVDMASIGRALNITREGVRRSIQKAIVKMKGFRE